MQEVDPVQATPAKTQLRSQALTAAVQDDSPEPLHHADIAATPEPYRTGDRKQGLGAVPPGGIPETPVPSFAARLSVAAETPDAQACHTGGSLSAPSSHTAYKAPRTLQPTVPEDSVFTPVAARSAFQPSSTAHSQASTAPSTAPSQDSVTQSAGSMLPGPSASGGGAADPFSADQTRGSPLGGSGIRDETAPPVASPDSQVRRLFHTQAPVHSPLVLSKAAQAEQLNMATGVSGGSPSGPAEAAAQPSPPGHNQVPQQVAVVE